MTPQTPRPGQPPRLRSGQAAPPPGGTDPAAAPRAAGSQTPGARLWGSHAPGAADERAAAGPVADGMGCAAAAGPHTSGPAVSSGEGPAGPGTPPTCRNCGTRRKRRPSGSWQGARGWCITCYSRWWRAGKPAGGPPPLRSPEELTRRARAAALAIVAGRREDYFWLRDEQTLTRQQAAERMGICPKTAERYDARRKAVTA